MASRVGAGRLLGGLVLLLANGFFVTTEFAMTRIRQFPESEFSGHAGLERAWQMTERLEVYLSGCQLGITVSSVGLEVVAEPAVTTVLAPLVGAVGIGVGKAGHGAVSVALALGFIDQFQANNQELALVVDGAPQGNNPDGVEQGYDPDGAGTQSGWSGSRAGRGTCDGDGYLRGDNRPARGQARPGIDRGLIN